jgi:hypothetical protein
MKQILVISGIAAVSWTFAAHAESPHQAPSANSAARANPHSGRPQATPHPSIVRPAEMKPVGGNNRQHNVPVVKPEPRAEAPHGEPAHVNPGHPGPGASPGHGGTVRPVHVDSRPRDVIRNDRFAVHFRPGIREEWRPVGFVSPGWQHYHPVLWWDAFPNNYTWWNVNAVTCQAQYLAADPANPENGDIFTADSVYRDWRWGTHDESMVANRTLDEALDECFATTVNRGQAGTCQPVENPEDNDGCFLTYGPH